MNILVTGGSGFIGTNLVQDLLKQGHNVLIYDKRRSEAFSSLCSVGDVRDKEKLESSMHGIEVVYHLAAEHRDDVRPVSLYNDVNVGGAENLIYVLEKHCVKKLIFTSTVALYGLNAGEPSEDSPVRPFNEYGKSKYKSELVFNEWAKGDESRCLVTVRPTAIFGEGNRGNVYTLLNQIASGSFIMVGNGKNRKSLGYVQNISKFLTLLLKTPPGISIYNYADKPDLDVNEMVMIALDALGRKRKLNFRIPYSIGLLGGYIFDLLAIITKRTYPISSLRIKKFCADTIITADRVKTIGFHAPCTIVEGLNRMILKEFLKGS